MIMTKGVFHRLLDEIRFLPPSSWRAPFFSLPQFRASALSQSSLIRRPGSALCPFPFCLGRFFPFACIPPPPLPSSGQKPSYSDFSPSPAHSSCHILYLPFPGYTWIRTGAHFGDLLKQRRDIPLPNPFFLLSDPTLYPPCFP